MSDTNGEKKHPATALRRKKAREEGQFARSRDLNLALILLSAVAGLWWSGPAIVACIAETMRVCWTLETAPRVDENVLLGSLARTLRNCLWTTLPLMLGISGVAILSHWIQSGFQLFPGKLGWDLEQVHPLKGVQRMLQASSWLQLLFAWIKIALVVAVVGYSLISQWAEIQQSTTNGIGPLAAVFWNTTLGVCLRIAIVLLLFAFLEYGLQWWLHERSLMMTDEELREELKDTSGDPQLLSARRSLRQRLASED